MMRKQKLFRRGLPSGSTPVKLKSLCISCVAVTFVAASSAQVPSVMPNLETTQLAPRAIQCVALFEIMDRAAPNWVAQASVQTAWQKWEKAALKLSDRYGVDFGEQVNQEMVKLADDAVSHPGRLSARAVACIADGPRY